MHPEAPVLTSKFVIDYFSDGSFCPLDAPGHAVGNLNALVRTSVSPHTFMLLGGDAARHDPLPESIALPGFAPNPMSSSSIRGSSCGRLRHGAVT